MMITLTILIPTYNRAHKLLRLLKTIEADILASDIKEQVQILISDNASIDNTHEIASEFLKTHPRYKYFRQSKNLGFDGNIRFLYNQSDTDYLWYIADDDMPLPGSISKILRALQDKNPDVLLFSFIQPPGSQVRQFDFSEPIKLFTDPIVAIEQVLHYTKLSIFVMRKTNFNSSQMQVLDKNAGSGWYYILLAFSVLEASQNLLLAVISEPLATCDEDYACISYAPYPLLHMDKMVKHSFVMKHQPNLSEFYSCRGYCQAIQFAFAAKVGTLSPQCYTEEYDNFIKDLECKIPILLRNPRSLLQYMALKLRITSLWVKIRYDARWISEVAPN
jgi:glycosyltransferase involved in cell wall biosynthesis